eukprot:4128483-Pleurochrysis_carterae.AAC.8
MIQAPRKDQRSDCAPYVPLMCKSSERRQLDSRNAIATIRMTLVIRPLCGTAAGLNDDGFL